MKDIHQNPIKYLTYQVLKKRKLDNKQTHVPPPNKIGLLVPHQSPPPQRRHETVHCITEYGDQCKANGLVVMLV